MNNKDINEFLQCGGDGKLLLHDPSIHHPGQDSFLPHVCGSVFFEQRKYKSKTISKDLDIHVIALRDSRRFYDFMSRYNLEYKVNIFEAINAMDSKFRYEDYKETHGIPPVKGEEGYLGCTLSHFRLWKKLAKTKKKYHLVLEDDAFCMSYANKALHILLDNIPDESDLIFVNGRASEKLYAGCKFEEGTYVNLPQKMIFSRKEMLSIMRENFQSLKRSKKKGAPILWSGTDGYIVTKSGVEKLNNFVEKYGISGPGGAANNIDTILTAITTDIHDHDLQNMAYGVSSKVKKGMISNEAIIDAHVCSYPLIDSSDRANIGYGSEIKKKEAWYKPSSADINLIRDSSLIIEDKCIVSACRLMGLASKLRPNGKWIRSEKIRLQKAIHWEKIQPRLQVNENKLFFFMHIPKTGGTSIDESNLFESPRFGHADLQRFKHLLADDYRYYRCFTLVRNPWDRLASAFYYISEGGSGSKWDLLTKANHIGRYQGDFKKFLGDFITLPTKYLKLLHFKPMIEFFNPQHCDVDFYIQKLESIDRLEELNDFLGMQLNMPHKRRRRSYANVQKVYDEALFMAIRQIYISDVNSFGYDKFTLDNIEN
jgi:GR25 family glycosyltransferase involved in LPS biosynthesis